MKGRVGAYGAGSNIMVGATIFSAVKITRFLCGQCGYSEEWVESAADIKKIREKYAK